MKLVKCNNCGKIFKVVKEDRNKLITDMNGVFVFNGNISKCLCCNRESTFSIINIREWIAEKVFSVKG